MESGSQAYGVHQIRHIGIIAIVDDLGALSVTAEACDPALALARSRRGLAGAPTSALPGGVVGRSAQFSRRSSRPKAALGLSKVRQALSMPLGLGPARVPEGIQEPAVMRPNDSTCRDMGGIAGSCSSPAMDRIWIKALR